MNLDYAYCSTTECIHRRGCKRNIKNHENSLYYEEPRRWINPYHCVNSKPYPYEFMDRFKNSDGSELDKEIK